MQGWAPEGPWVLTSIVPDGGGITTATFAANEVPRMRDWIEDRQGAQNIYFTVNAVMRPMAIKPKKTDIRGMRAIHVDVDPRAGEDAEAEKDRAVKLLREYDLAPTVIIDSGNGAQGAVRRDADAVLRTPQRQDPGGGDVGREVQHPSPGLCVPLC